MDKIAKILSQSVTPQMISEQLTEQEIEEFIEECDLKVEGAKKDLKQSVEMKEMTTKTLEELQTSASDCGMVTKEERQELDTKIEKVQSFVDGWREFEEEDNKMLKAWQIVVEKARRALVHKKYTTLTPNEQRAKIIDEAKSELEEFESMNSLFGRTIWFVVKKEERRVSASVTKGDKVIGTGSATCHPNDVWNEHIGRIIALRRAFGDDASKFENAPQPTEIVEGMDVLTGNVKRDGFKIISDTRAKYKEV